MTSKIEKYNGIPTLFINEEPISCAAYMTYLEENARYEDFTKAGSRLFSFSSFFAERTINPMGQIRPLKKGIFENKGKPNFNVFDEEVELILKACPEAFIIPRVNVMMPKWWEEENIAEVNNLTDGSIVRESFSSTKWRYDVAKHLLLLIDHIEKSNYREHIIGYHISGGQTEEFFHFGSPNGGFGECAKRGFLKFIKENYPDEVDIVNSLPNYDYGNEEFITDKFLLRFLEYTSIAIADSIRYLALAVKTRTERKLIVGSFYGYTMELCDSRFGHHAFESLLNCNDFDFFAAPNSYMQIRKGGIDWANMSVLDSIKLHNKYFFAECDTRTALTKPLGESRKDSCPQGTYIGGVWEGPKSIEVSRWLIRNTFARQLTHGCGFWWFDMWGGWYANTDIMDDLKQYNSILKNSLNDKHRESIAEVAVIVDEKSYKYINPNIGLASSWNYNNRLPLGLAGAPYDIFDIYDIDKISKDYKLVIFLATLCDDGRAQTYIEKCINNGGKVMLTYKPFEITGSNLNCNNESIIHYPNYILTTEELRKAYRKANVHIWCSSDDVIYASSNCVSIHSEFEGQKTIYLNSTRDITPLFSTEKQFINNKIDLYLKKYETKMYRLE